MARHWVGTSGWSHDHWKGPFYREKLQRTDWLVHYAERLASVEINASFYNLPRERVLAGWAECTPPGFLFAVKAWRAITHHRRLANCGEAVATFLGRLAALGAKCGPVLFQLPPRWRADHARLAAFLDVLPEGRRYVFEFRDPSWHSDAILALLEARNAAFCPFELGALTAPRVATADFVYVRLHGREARYRGDYDDEALGDWAAWLKARKGEGRDVYVYFDNTEEADCALGNAHRLGELLENGLENGDSI